MKTNNNLLATTGILLATSLLLKNKKTQSIGAISGSREIHDIALGYVEDIETAYNDGELLDYINEHALDIEFTITSGMDYIGSEIAIALGGPSVYINTRDKRVEAYWGGEQAFVSLDSDVVSELDYYFEDMYESGR